MPPRQKYIYPRSGLFYRGKMSTDELHTFDVGDKVIMPARLDKGRGIILSRFEASWNKGMICYEVQFRTGRCGCVLGQELEHINKTWGHS